MNNSSSHSFLLPLIFLIFALAQAKVPASKTFKFINEGEYGEYTVEYDAYYRPSPLVTFPFMLCFFNTTPDSFILGLRMGNRHSESVFRWIWDANRGNPVHENATLTFGTDGNLVLADADGRVAWQTGTSDKGVVDLKLLPNGNMVLLDSRGKFVWQSFDHPTDTLLVGQSLRISRPNKLVSRISDNDASEGLYSLVLEKKRMAMYLKSRNNAKPLLYYIPNVFGSQPSEVSIMFNSALDPYDEYAYQLSYDVYYGGKFATSITVARLKYNSTLSFLRLGSDGSLRVFTFHDKISYGAWEVAYNLFDKHGEYSVSECKMPTRCGSLGVCEDSQCIACPRPQGLLGWSKECAPPRLPPCKAGAKSIINYYKVVGVEHFTGAYMQGDGPTTLADCRGKCSKDCWCLGFFYREEISKCYLAPELGTLTKVSNQTHLAYIKMSK